MSKYDDLNSILLEGRLVKDPVKKDFENNKCVCNFTIAVNHSYKIKDGSYKQETSFIEIQVWNGAANLCCKYLTKGSQIRLRGVLKQQRWEDKEQKKYSKIIVCANHVEFRETKKKEIDELKDKNKKEGLKDSFVVEPTADLNNIPVF